MTGDLPAARAVAAEAHRGQVDKAGQPYLNHPKAVARALEEYGETAMMAGWLHDVVEDSRFTLEDLRDYGFPPEVVAAVDSVTRRDGETYMDMIRRAAADPLGRLVKIADVSHNSDEARLAKLPADVADGLRRRYAKARKVLVAADGNSKKGIKS